MKVYPKPQPDEPVRVHGPRRIGSVPTDAEPMAVYACERRLNGDIVWLAPDGSLTTTPAAHMATSLRELSDRVKASPDFQGGRVSVVTDPASVEPYVDLSREMERAEIVNEALDLVMSMLSAPIIELPPPSVDDQPFPEQYFADLMLADETAEDAKVRLTEKLKLLRHYLMAPEIKVNEDGSFGLLKDEQDELKDLERRQAQGRWLDA